MLAAHFRARSALIAFACALALGHRCALRRPPVAATEALAAYLGAETSATEPHVVEPGSIQWEPSGGPLRDLLVGRWVLFLGSAGVEEPRDLYRARVRVGPDGSVLEVNKWRNLTQTPLGDEMHLALREQRAVFASRAFGQLQGLSVLSLDGAPDLEHGGLLNRMLLRIRAYQETGAWAGVGRLHLSLDASGPLTVRFDSQQLEVRAEERPHRAQIHFQPLSVEQNAHLVESVAEQHYGGDFWLHTLVDVARDAVGPEPLAWLEAHVFQWRDWWRQRGQSQGRPVVATVTTRATDSTNGELPLWPPAPVSPLLEPALEGEGNWSAAGFGVEQRPFPAGEQGPAFASTWLRPDPKRPYARLHLIAMDMRRLALGMEAGFEEPKPKTGPPGRGSLSGDVTTRERVAATFNGAFKSVHGDYGMMVDGRILVPPKPRSASVVVRRDGWVGFGTWPDTQTIPSDVRFFRQNLDPLVAGGQVNPVGRQEWGMRLTGGSVVTERSALCRTGTGQLYYAWGSELTGESLADGLHRAGCSYALHLDMNPGHAGFVFTRVRGTAPEGVEGQLAVPEMTIHPREHAVWSDKDFFYVLDNASTDRVGSASDASSSIDWQASPGAQPPPEVWPAVWEGTVSLGALPVHLLRVEPGRVSYAVTASSMEPMVLGQAAPRRQLPEEEMSRAIMAVSFGHTTSSLGYGMVFGHRVTLPLRTGYGNLVVREQGALEVYGANAATSAQGRDVVVQLPELVSAGVVTPQASLRGGRRRRGGVCVIDGRLWIATVDHDSSDPVAVTLRSLGCNTVLELDRGSKHAVSIQRHELSALREPENETGYLWALSTQMRPRTYEF